MDKNHTKTTPKTTPDKTFQTKDPLTKAPGQKPPRTIERKFVQGAFSEFFVLGLLKIGWGWGPRCVTYFDGIPELESDRNSVSVTVSAPKLPNFLVWAWFRLRP